MSDMRVRVTVLDRQLDTFWGTLFLLHWNQRVSVTHIFDLSPGKKVW